MLFRSVVVMLVGQGLKTKVFLYLFAVIVALGTSNEKFSKPEKGS